MREQNGNKIEYFPIASVGGRELGKFIEERIAPYFTIPLSKKMTAKNIEEYGEKLVTLSDGYVAISAGKIVGCIAAYIRNRIDPFLVYLSIFGVDADFRNQGIGTELLYKLMADVPEECAIHAYVDEANEMAWRLYQKVGFYSESILDGRRKIVHPFSLKKC